MKDRIWRGYRHIEDDGFIHAAGLDKNQVRLFWYDSRKHTLFILWEDGTTQQYKGHIARCLREALT